MNHSTSYNFSISLIRSTDNSWSIDPWVESTQSLYQNLLAENPGNNFLATKTQGELSYYIFHHEDLVHSDLCGWIITLNGYQLDDQESLLALSQQAWTRLADSQLASLDLHQRLYDIIEDMQIIACSAPRPIDMNKESSYEVKRFSIRREQAPQPSVSSPRYTPSSSSSDHLEGTYVAQEGKGLFTYFVECYTKHFADFSGRARRREYWGAVLFNILLAYVIRSFLILSVRQDISSSIASGELESASSTGPVSISLLFILSLFLVPGLAVTVRRLHDTGRSGWWLLIGVIPILGLVIIYWLCSDGSPEKNEYGESPKYKRP